MGGFGVQEFFLVVVIILLFIGAKTIPERMGNANKRHGSV